MRLNNFPVILKSGLNRRFLVIHYEKMVEKIGNRKIWFMQNKTILVQFFWSLIFMAMQIQAAVVTGENPDGGWQEEKTSETSQLYRINYDNKQIISALRDQTAVLKIPGAIKDIEPGEHLRLRFLANKLEDFEVVHKENKKLFSICYNEASEWPKEWVTTSPGGVLPEIKPEHIADFSTTYRPSTLVLYGIVIAAQGKQKLDLVLKDRRLPNEKVLQTEWRKQRERLRQFGDFPARSLTERLVGTIKYRSNQAIAIITAQDGAIGQVVPQPIVVHQPVAVRSTATLLRDFDPINGAFHESEGKR